MTFRNASSRQSTGVHLVAMLELVKGLLVLLVGCGVLALVHRDVHQAAEELVRLSHLNPANHTPQVFLETASKVTDSRLWLLAAGALGYALLRFVEAWGLWREKAWAEWLGAVTGGIYIPIEIFELVQRVTWARVAVFVTNVVVVAVLVYALKRRRDVAALGGDAA